MIDDTGNQTLTNDCWLESSQNYESLRNIVIDGIQDLHQKPALSMELTNVTGYENMVCGVINSVQKGRLKGKQRLRQFLASPILPLKEVRLRAAKHRKQF